RMTHESPEIFLKSDDFTMIEKSMFISIIEKEDLELDEIDIWEHVIRWGRGQIENLNEKDISEWNENDFNELKSTLHDIIPLIRFEFISPTEFFDKVRPYKNIFDTKIYDEILKYHLGYGKT